IIPWRRSASSSRSPASVSGRSKNAPSANCAIRSPAASSRTIWPDHRLACTRKHGSCSLPAIMPVSRQPFRRVCSFIQQLPLRSQPEQGGCMPKWHRAEHPTAIAPDGAEIRSLVDRAQGTARLSLAEALVRPGQHTAKVYHQTIYEEIWYFLQGAGTFHLHAPEADREEVTEVASGDAVHIPPRHGFWVENTSGSDLIFLCCGSPPWPGDQEAQRWPPVNE